MGCWPFEWICVVESGRSSFRAIWTSLETTPRGRVVGDRVCEPLQNSRELAWDPGHVEWRQGSNINGDHQDHPGPRAVRFFVGFLRII